jgi:3-methyladenine DNA glycosylase Tag
MTFAQVNLTTGNTITIWSHWEKRFMMLEGFQVGLSWIVILRKREIFKSPHPANVTLFRETDIARPLMNHGKVPEHIKAKFKGALPQTRHSSSA